MVDKKLISQAVVRIVEKIKPDRIILFGSQARGSADDRSDVDLLVISRFTGKRREILADLYLTLRNSGFAQDIILMTPEEYESERRIPGTVARPASKEGKVLYERSR
jgi:uncharacterized protein